jgi:hypothetical protein
MRLPFILLLLLACSPAVSTSAAPFAQYHPATGDVTFNNVRGQLKLGLFSRSRQLNPDMDMTSIEVSPLGSTPPVADGYGGGAGWALLPNAPFDFDTLTVHRAVQPFTPLSDLSMSYHHPGIFMRIEAAVVQVPEPSTLLLSMAGVLGLSLRRRIRPLPAPA